MPEKTVVMLIVGAALLTDASALAQDSSRREQIRKAIVQKYDANKNGKLDEDEEAVVLKKYDANGNGQLDRDEKVTMAKALAGGRRAKAGNEPEAEATAGSKWDTPGFKSANSLGGGKADVPKDSVFRVYVLMGQSNMVGMGKKHELKAPHNQKHERIRVWANGQWEYLVPSRTFGPEVSMAHQLAEFWPDDTIGIIKVASGGTGIRGFEKNWAKERAALTFDQGKGPLYKDLMHAVEAAKQTSRPAFSGFVWKQGGADGTKKVLADEYLGTFTQLVSDLRKDLSTPDMPVFVLTYLNDEAIAVMEKTAANKRKYIGTVLRAQNQAGRDIPNTHVVHHGKLPLSDQVHFNTEGQITLGKMTADSVQTAYRKMKK